MSVAKGGWISGVSPLPIHPPLVLGPLPASVLRRTQLRQLLAAHRGPGEVNRWSLSLLLPYLHAELLQWRHVVVSSLSDRRAWRYADGV